MANKCTLEIVKAANGKMTEKQAEALRQNIEELAKQRVRRRKSKPATAVKDATDELIKEAKAVKAMREANRLRHALRKAELYSHVDQFGDEEFMRGVQSIFEDLKGTQDGMGRNVDGLKKMYSNVFINKLRGRLESSNVLQLAMGGKLDLEIWKETYNLGMKVPEPAGKVSGSEQAGIIAKHIYDVRNELRGRLNAEGANIGEILGYTHNQKWEVDIVRKGGRSYKGKPLDEEQARKRFIDFFKDRIDKERTLKPGTTAEQFLGKYYDNYVANHFGTDKKTHVGIDNLKSPLTSRLNSERKLHLATPEDSHAAALEYGQTNLMDGVTTQIESMSRSLALLERLGPDPDRQFRELVNHYRDKFYAEGKREMSANLAEGNPGYAKLREIFGFATGEGLIPVSNTVANFTTNTKSLIRQATLGGSGITAITDPVFANNTLANRGISSLDAAARQFEAYLGDLTNRGQKSAAKAAAVGMDMFNGTVTRRLDATSSKTTGIIGAMERWFFKLTGLSLITDASKRANWAVMASLVGDFSGSKFAELEPDFRLNLQRFNISEAEWDLLRGYAGSVREKTYLDMDAIEWVSDHKVIMADEITDVNSAVLKQLGLKDTPANRNRALNRVKDKLNALYIDFIETAVPTPGAREQRQLMLGTRPGTGIGAAVSLATMLKSFPQTVMNKNVGETFRLRGGSFKKGGVKNFIREGSGPLAMMRLAALTTIFGYFSMTIKDWLNGKSRRPLVDEDGNIRYATFFQAFQRGGATGFYGDFLLSEYDRSYRSFSQSLLGPALGRLDPIADVATRAVTGEDFATQGTRLLLDNTPMINLFYIKPVLNQMFFYELNEAISPGWTERARKSAMENSGQVLGGGPFPFLGPQ